MAGQKFERTKVQLCSLFGSQEAKKIKAPWVIIYINQQMEEIKVELENIRKGIIGISGNQFLVKLSRVHHEADGRPSGLC